MLHVPPLLTTVEAHPKRNLLFLSNTSLWSHWPFLPVVRHRPGREEDYGILFDAMTVLNLPGFSATVFLCNMFQVPRQLRDLFDLPREVYDRPEEIEAAGWRVD